MIRATIQNPNREDAISSSIVALSVFSAEKSADARPCCGKSSKDPNNYKLPKKLKRTGFRSCRCCSTNNKSGQSVLCNFVAGSKLRVFLTRIEIEPRERGFE